MDDWPFQISERQATIELEEGARREASYDEEVMWVARNIGNVAARPSEAPSNAAWQMLVLSERNPVEKRNFYKEHYRGVALRGMDQDEDTVSRRSQIHQFDLLEQFQSWQKCPHCGERLFNADR